MKILNISQVDTIFANGSYPIEFLFYYKNKLDSMKIRSALKKISGDFWPVFGMYENGQILYDRYKEDECFDEESVRQPFNPDQDNARLYAEFGTAAPKDMSRLFYLKVIQFDNGTVLIPKLNHLAGDGYSYFYFLAVLAQMVKNKSIPLKNTVIRLLARPKHSRTILREFQLPDIRFNPPKLVSDMNIEDLKVPKAEIRKQIRQLAGKPDQKVSTNDILSAMILKKLIGFRQDKGEFRLSIPVDVRRHIKKYGAKFFGNGLMFNRINFNHDEIREMDIDAMALKIRRCMPEITEDIYLNYLKELERLIDSDQTEKLRPYDPDSGCLVTNLSRLPANRLDFGAGNPDLIFPLTIGKNAASILADEDNFVLRIVY